MIPFAPLWAQYRRVIKNNGAIVLFGSQPFTSLLVCSNLAWFRYQWVWKKNKATGFLDCKKKPLKAHEDICVFYGAQPTFHPQMREGKSHSRGGIATGPGEVYHDFSNRSQTVSDLYYPQSIIEFPVDMKPSHPTQKPVSLLAYLIRTYTNEGETVLDSCAGSGGTLVACVETGRNGIGIELREEYYDIACRRVRQKEDSLDGKNIGK